MRFENIIRRWAKIILAIVPVPLSRNERIDRSTQKIIQRIASENKTCIDIGAHEGKILDWMTRYIPSRQHLAFEPLPQLFDALQHRFGNEVQLYQLALSDRQGTIDFNEVLSDPAYSGILKRPYPRFMKDRKIKVKTNWLDHVVAAEMPIALIKIDVEGAEFSVLKGATQLISQQKPLLLFECGKAGGETYGYQAKDMFALLNDELHYDIYLPEDWLQQKKWLSSDTFEQYYETGSQFFFLGAPQLHYPRI